MSALRLGLLTYGLDRPPTGIGRHTIELIGALAQYQNGIRISLLSPSPPKYLPKSISLPQQAVPGCRTLPALLTLGNLVLRNIATRDQFDIFHDPTGHAPFLFGAGQAKTVVTIHDIFGLSFPSTSTLVESLEARFWLRLVLPRLDAILTDSQASKRDILRFMRLPAQRVHVIPSAAGAEFRPINRKQVESVLSAYGLAPGYLLVVVGSQDKRRNLPRLLEAYAGLVRAGEQRPLVVIGKAKRSVSAASEALSRSVKDVRSRNHQVVYLGYVPSAHLPALYNGADLFVFPSLYEGFGLPPLEAMACGTPVVCSNATSLPEVVGEAALTFDPYDTAAMAAVIQRALAEPALRVDLRQRGLERAARFSWVRSAQQTVAIYKTLFA